MPIGRVVNSVKDVLAVIIEIIESAKEEIVFLTPSFIVIPRRHFWIYAEHQAVHTKRRDGQGYCAHIACKHRTGADTAGYR